MIPNEYDAATDPNPDVDEVPGDENIPPSARAAEMLTQVLVQQSELMTQIQALNANLSEILPTFLKFKPLLDAMPVPPMGGNGPAGLMMPPGMPPMPMPPVRRR